MKAVYQLFQTKVLLSEGTIQQRFIARCTKEQKEILKVSYFTNIDTSKNFTNLCFFMGKKTKNDENKSQLYLEFIVSNGNVDLVQIKMQRFFKAYRKICIKTKINKLQSNLLEL